MRDHSKLLGVDLFLSASMDYHVFASVTLTAGVPDPSLHPNLSRNLNLEKPPNLLRRNTDDSNPMNYATLAVHGNHDVEGGSLQDEAGTEVPIPSPCVLCPLPQCCVQIQDFDVAVALTRCSHHVLQGAVVLRYDLPGFRLYPNLQSNHTHFLEP